MARLRSKEFPSIMAFWLLTLLFILIPSDAMSIFYRPDFQGHRVFQNIEPFERRIDLDTVEKAIKAGRDNADTLIGAAGLLKIRGVVQGAPYYKRAIRLYERAISLEPENPVPYANLLDVYLAPNREDAPKYDAEEIDSLLRRARAVEPDNGLYNYVKAYSSLRENAENDAWLDMAKEASRKSYVSFHRKEAVTAKLNFLVDLEVCPELTAKWVATCHDTHILPCVFVGNRRLIDKAKALSEKGDTEKVDAIAAILEQFPVQVDKKSCDYEVKFWIVQFYKKDIYRFLKKYYAERGEEERSREFERKLRDLRLVYDSRTLATFYHLDATRHLDEPPPQRWHDENINTATEKELNRLFDIFYNEDYLQYELEVYKSTGWREPLKKDYSHKNGCTE